MSASSRRRIAASLVPGRRPIAMLAASMPAPALAAIPQADNAWLTWLVLGALVVFVAGVVLRMVLAARFPRGYRKWAADRRESFAANSEAFDRDDEQFRR